MVTLETHQKYFRVDRRNICHLKFFFEACDGIAVMTTLDAENGLVVLKIAPGCEAEVDGLIEELRKEILIEPVPIDEVTRYKKPF